MAIFQKNQRNLICKVGNVIIKNAVMIDVKYMQDTRFESETDDVNDTTISLNNDTTGEVTIHLNEGSVFNDALNLLFQTDKRKKRATLRSFSCFSLDSRTVVTSDQCFIEQLPQNISFKKELVVKEWKLKLLDMKVNDGGNNFVSFNASDLGL